MPTLTIDNQRVSAPDGATILEAARGAGIHIPTLCHHPDLSNVGACRMCVVSVEKARGVQTACTTPVTEGMVVSTNSPDAVATRRFVLEMLLSDHPNECMTCEVNGDCELQDLVYDYDVPWPEHNGRRHTYLINPDPNPFIFIDRNKCILCGRCVRACGEIQNRDVWSFAMRGFETKLVAGADEFMLDAGCESCGQCVAYCPTGALFDKMSVGKGRAGQTQKVRTTCAYCGVGCTFDLNVRHTSTGAGGRVIRVTSAQDAPVNGLALCVKGRYGYDYVHNSERLTRPLVRAKWLDAAEVERQVTGNRWTVIGNAEKRRSPVTDHRSPVTDDTFIAVDWDTALDVIANKLAAEKMQHGGRSFAMLASAKCTNEENYLFAKFTRQLMGSNNVDHCARLCHASTVVGLAASFGSGAMTNTISDIAADSRSIFVIGSNTTEQHPVIGTKLRRAKRQRGAKLIVADPRQIGIAEVADLHLRHRPGTDVALLNGLMHVIIREGWHDAAFIAERTEGFEELAATVAKYTPHLTSEITGVPAADIERAAQMLAEHRPGALVYAMGITQHKAGVANVMSCANLQMLLGNMGVPGGGVNPLRGQNNVQGACDMGALPNVHSGYQPVTNPNSQTKFEAAWGVPLPNQVGLTVTEMIHAAERGDVRCLYIVGENPMTSDPDLAHVQVSLDKTEFIVLQELFFSETAAFADVILPAASFAEKEGTFTNTERRIQRVRKAVEPPGEARLDTWIITELAQRLIALNAATPDPAAPWFAWPQRTAPEIMAEINALTPSYAGVTYRRLEAGAPLLWPVPDEGHPGTPILHVGKFTRGLGRFAAVDHAPPGERPDEEYPVVMTTGRVLYHWHGGEMTRRANGLLAVYPEALVEISSEDAQRLGVADGDMVRLVSRRGAVEAKAWVTERVSRDLVFTTFHFPDQAANWLTSAEHLDPVAKIPEFKVTAVRLEKV